MLPERSGKQQQQQLGQKASVDKEQAGSVHERERTKVAPNGTNRQPRSASPPPAAPAHTPYCPPTHPPTSPHTTGRHVAAASCATASGSRWWTPEIALQRQLLRAP